MRISSKRTKTLGSTLLPLLCMVALAGCQQAVDTRWARQGDSPDAWQPALTDIPVDIHNQGLSSDQLQAYLATHGHAKGSWQKAHLELYVGGSEVPTSASYCTPHPVLRAVSSHGEGILIAGALCDGDRLVATEQTSMPDDAMASINFDKALDTFKAGLVDGLAKDPYQAPAQYEY